MQIFKLFRYCLLVLFLSVFPFQQPLQANTDSTKIVGPDDCIECHKRSGDVWFQTPHYTGFKQMSRSKEAKDIAEKLGIKRIKSDSTCMQCHYTPQKIDNGIKAIAGISCESCHGAGKGYVDIHCDYGGKDIKKENETPAHAKSRIEKSEKAGMIRPADLYALAKNCYECHTVPNEKLVNTGGHNSGSKFELVSWSQGMVRHNNWFTPENSASSPERLRVMYVVGKMVEMEFALRGLAKATTKADYAKAFVFRYKTALNDLKQIADTGAPVPAVNDIITTAKKAGIKLNANAELTAVADKISRIARKFASTNNGEELGAIDPLLPSPASYKGKVHQTKK